MAGSLKKFAEALALGMSPTDSAEAAGYPCGKSEKTFAANARRRAGSKRVRKIVDELQKPAKEKLAKTIEANFEWATKQLLEIGNLPIGILNTRASDKIRAIEVLAKLYGWNASEKHQAQGNVTIHATYTVEPRPQEENPT